MVRKKNKKDSLGARFMDGYNFAIVIGFISSFTLFLVIFMWMTTSPFFGQEDLFDYLLGKSYEVIEKSWAENNEAVSSLAYLCSQRDKDDDKVLCVYFFIRDNLKPFHHHKFSNILRTPEDLLGKGGICRDVAVFACSVFFDMGIECDYIMEPSHVYNRVTLDDRVCKMDIAKGKLVCYNKTNEKRILLNISNY